MEHKCEGCRWLKTKVMGEKDAERTKDDTYRSTFLMCSYPGIIGAAAVISDMPCPKKNQDA